MAVYKGIDHTVKIMILGESKIGKTSFINRYTNNVFRLNYISTIGIDFQIKNIEIEEKNIKLQIWDTAGQECFKSLTKNYFRNSHGFIIGYDITDRNSFEAIDDWIRQIKEFRDCKNNIVIIGTKSDLEDERVVSTEEGRQLAKEHYTQFYETTAKDNINVNETFNYISQEILHSIENGEIPERTSIAINNKKGSKNKCC